MRVLARRYCTNWTRVHARARMQVDRCLVHMMHAHATFHACMCSWALNMHHMQTVCSLLLWRQLRKRCMAPWMYLEAIPQVFSSRQILSISHLFLIEPPSPAKSLFWVIR